MAIEEDQNASDNQSDQKAKDGDEREPQLSMEQIFESQKVPSWREQLTFRAIGVSLILSIFFSFIVMRLNLTVGIIPSLNVAAGLLGYFLITIWTKIVSKFGLLKQPFTRQENTVIQTCVVASSGIAFSGGFGSYLLGMSEKIASQAGEGNTPANMKHLSLGWIIGFLFAVSFVGLFSIVPLRKIMIIDHKLIYPSGTATAHLINSFHTPQGAKLVKKQVQALFKTFGFSFLWALCQWFYTASDDCGFTAFPIFGLEAYKNKFYFDFSATYVGVGMICPYIINISLLAGGILSWGIMWPIIESKKGDWYSEKLSPSSLHGLNGYKVFVGIAVILGDGLFHFTALLVKTIRDLTTNCIRKEPETVLPVDQQPSLGSLIGYDDMRRKEYFLKDQIPKKIAFGGYLLLAAISTIAVPNIFPQLKWYHILVTYLFAPIFAFCNAYGCGLTDWSLASSYGKLAIILFGAWVGLSAGGVIAGLAACGVMMSIVSTASDLMQDFKTGYLTLASPRAMFFSQVIGTVMGCVIGPCVFWIFYNAYPIGEAGSQYPAPYATLYRGIALLGVEGIDNLPKNCLTLCIVFFVIAFSFSAFKEAAKHFKWRVHNFMPNIMAMAIPFFIGSYFAIDMCLGSLILFLWRRSNLSQAEAFAPAVASGMICGDGIWSLPSSLLSLANLKPPICMKFLSKSTNARVDSFLSG